MLMGRAVSSFGLKIKKTNLTHSCLEGIPTVHGQGVINFQSFKSVIYVYNI
jgi:hypothetical protein